MPQVVNIPEVGQVRFPDEMTTDEITSVIQTQILPQFQKQSVIQATPVPASEEAVSDNLLGRFAGALSENAAIVTQGAGRVLQQTPMYRALQLGAEAVGLGEYGPSSNIDKLTGFAREVQAQSRPSYGVTTPADTLVEQVVEGAASLPTVIAAGPAAPAVNAVLMGESQRQEAEAAGATQAQQDAAFGGAATVGLISEQLLGIPAMLRGGGGRRVLDTVGLGIAREGTQEAVDQLGQNVVAKGIYDPDRDLTEGVKESAVVGGILGAPLGPLMQGPREGAPVAPESPDLTAVASVLEDTDQPDLTGFGSAARESIPPPLPPSPTEQVSATVLGKDVTELRQQEAIATGQPVPEINEGAQTSELAYGRALDPYDAFAGVQQAPESPAPDAVEAPLAPEEGQDTTQTPEGLVAVDPDTYERLADEPVQDGFVAYQDEATDAIFQVPANATPEQVQEAVVAARQENTEATYKLIEQQVAEEAAILRGEREQLEAVVAKQPRTTPSTRGAQIDPLEKPTQDDFKTFPADPTPEQQSEMRKLEEQGWEAEKLPSGNTRMVSEKEVYRKDLLSGEAATKVWTDVDRLKFILDRMEMNLAKAKKGNLEDAQGQPVMPDELEAGVKKLRRRYNFLKKRVAAAQQQMNRKKDAGEQGGTAIPQAAFELGQAIYRKGMAFKDWSSAMIRQLGSKIRPFLADLWSSVVSGVNSLSPAGRRFKRSGSVGRQSPQEVYDVFSEDLRASKKDTQPNQDFGEADKQAVRDAYAELQAETGFAGVSIADVMERAGFPLTNQSKGLLMQMYRDGEITSLNMGDWSLSDARKRAWGVRNNGDIFLTVTMPQGMRRSAPSPEGGALGSQGGRRQPRPESISNESSAQTREDLGMDPRIAPIRRTDPEVWDEAMAKLTAQPGLTDNLIASLKNRTRPIEDVEGVLLLHRKIELLKQEDAAFDQISNSTTEAEVEFAQESLKRVQTDLAELTLVMESTGTATARGLRIRQQFREDDFSLARMRKIKRTGANEGKDLSQEQEAEVAKLHAELQAARNAARDAEARAKAAEAQATFANLINEFKKERAESIKAGAKAGKSLTDIFIERGEAASARLRERMQKVGSFPDVGIFKDVVEIALGQIAKGVKTVAEFTEKLVADYGEEIRPYAEQGWDAAQTMKAQDEKRYSPPTEPTPAEILSTPPTELDRKTVFDLAKAYVRQGMTGMENVMTAVHADLVKFLPGITVRDVRDAFSDYGKVTYPSKENDAVQLRQMREIARLTSQYEDALRRIAPLRTGPQRDKMTAEARELQKKIHALMREYDLAPVNKFQQLTTSREAIKNRLRNEIEELERAIENKTRRPEGREPTKPDPEIQALQARRDKLKQRYEEIFPRAKMTPEQRIQQTLNALDKAISEETQMLKDGILKRPVKAAGPTSTEIENKQMELDALRQLRRELFAATQPRKAPEDIALEQAVKAAEASIKRMDEMLRSGNLSPEARTRKFTPTAELEALWSERDAMRDVLAELRKAEKPRTDPQERARKATIKALEKSIAQLDQRILTGDFSPTPRKATRPETKEVAELRDIRDQMRKTLKDLKKAATPIRDPEEVRLSRDKKMIQNRIKKLQEKIAKGDYTLAVKRDPAMDDQKRKLQFQEHQLKEQFLKGVFEEQLKNRSAGKKAWDTALETANTVRSVMASSELSGVMRQGGFLVGSHPIRSVAALKDMVKAIKSERGFYETQQDIRDEPDYQNGKFQAAGLYIAEDAPASLEKTEEAYMSRWVNDMKGWKGAAFGSVAGAIHGARSGGFIGLLTGSTYMGALGGGIIGGTVGAAGWTPASQRAYIAFLNRLRVDNFKALEATLTMSGKATDKEAKVLANFVNVATGRGTLGIKALERSVKGLNALFFAPKYVASRFQLLLLQPLWRGNVRTRKLVAMEYVRYLAGTVVVNSLLYGLMSALRDDDDKEVKFKWGIKDMTNSDFMKIIANNVRLDAGTGILQNVVFLSRMISGEMQSTKGRVYDLDNPKRPTDPTRLTVLTNFFRSKMAPVPAVIADRLGLQNVVGEKFTWRGALERSAAPMSAAEIEDAAMDLGFPRGVITTAAIFFGIGANTHKEREKKPKKESRKAYEASKY